MHPDRPTWRESDGRLHLWRPHFGFSGHQAEHIFMHVEDSPLVLGKENSVFKAAFPNKLPLAHTQNPTEGERLSRFMEKRSGLHL